MDAAERNSFRAFSSAVGRSCCRLGRAAPQLPHQIQRSRNENSVAGRAHCQGRVKSSTRVRNNLRRFRIVAPNLCKLRSRNRPRRGRLSKNHVCGARENDPCNFVHSFVAQRAKNHHNPSPSKVFANERTQFARRRRIVSPIHKYIRLRTNFFDSAGPHRGRDAQLDDAVRQPIPLLFQKVRGRDGIQSVLKLKPPRKLRINVDCLFRPALPYDCSNPALFHLQRLHGVH